MPKNKWIEIISLRLSSLTHRKAVLEIFNQIKHEIETTTKIPQQAELYVNESIETDWSIYLHWNSHRNAQKSIIGLTIAESFCSFGLVNHSVWERKDGVNKIAPEDTPAQGNKNFYTRS